VLSLLLTLALSISPVYPPLHDVREPDLTAPVGAGRALAYSLDGRVAAIASGKEVRLYSARTGEDQTGALIHTLAAGAEVVAVAFTAPRVVTALDAEGAVYKWDPDGGKPLPGAVKLGQLENPTFRPGPEPWLAGVAQGKVVLASHDTGAVVKTFDDHGLLAFGPGGQSLAVAREQIRVWDVTRGTVSKTIDAARVRALAVSADRVAAGFADGTVKVWGSETRSWKAHRGPITALTFSGKGDQLASAAGTEIEVWDPASGERLCTQHGHTGAVQAVAFNPNGQKMASLAADRTMRLWTVPLPILAPDQLEKIAAAIPARAAHARQRRRVLVLWRADAILHKGGVPAANKALELMARKTGAFEVAFTRDLRVLDPRVLARYDAIVFNSTAHLVIGDDARKAALLDFVRRGGGVVGIHAAIDMFRTWPEGAQIVGATFAGHPWHPDGTWAVKLEKPDHPLLRAFAGKGFKMHDEFYELGPPFTREDRQVLMSLDLSDQATAGVTPLHRTDRDFAVAWTKTFGKGRVFYCMFGHLADPFQLPAVLQFYLDGIQYVLGDL
jgi:type 1 glutamine amidotransferase